MVNVVEIVLELEASGFINTGKVTRGRVVRAIPEGGLSCQVDDGIRGVAEPQGPFDSVDDARDAVLEYWSRCNTALQSEFWKPNLAR